MNKSRILFILLISFITMFGFKLDVIAKEKKEKVLTCVYDMGDLSSVKGFTLKQDEKGNKRGYTNNTNYNLQNEENYWQAVSSTTTIKPAGALKECPDKVSLYTQQDSVSETVWYDFTVGGENLTCGSGYVCGKLDKKQSGEGDKEITTSIGGMIESKNGNKKCNELSTPWLNDKTNTSTLSCLYGSDVNEGCHIIQLDVGGTTGIRVWSNYGTLNSKFAGKPVNLVGKFAETSQEVSGLFSGTCPPIIKVYINNVFNKFINVADATNGELFLDYATYGILNGGVKGNNLVTGDPAKFGDYKDLISIVEIDDVPKSCNEIIDSKMIEILHLLVNIFKILVPIILLVLGSLDLVQAVFSQDESGIKKAQGKFIKRLIIAVVIFLIPTILHVILLIANSVWSFIDPNLCGII